VSIYTKRFISLLVPLTAFFVVLFIVSCALGRYPISPLEVARLLFIAPFTSVAGAPVSQEAIVLLQVRLPRIAAAALIGAGLSASGAAYQGLFRNPLVSPDVLGVSAGAGFGAALGIFFSLGALGITLLSFGLGLVTALAVGLLARRVGNDSTLALVLSGIMVGSLLSSALSFLKLVADPSNVLPAITYWLMGSLSSIKQGDTLFVLPLIVGALVLLYLLRWRINVLTLGDEEARSLGTAVGLSRVLVIVAATLATAASVSVSGMIGWVGLVIPHFARMVGGSDYRYLIPLSMVMGASYLLLVDDLARLLTTAEIPIGILTSFVGVPFFLYLIRRGRIA
jgi:iron complex transport system permease protein